MTRTFQHACAAVEAALAERVGEHRAAMDAMLRELARGGANRAEIEDWEAFVADRVASERVER